MTPKFQVGEKVYHKGKQTYGVVTKVFPSEDSQAKDPGRKTPYYPFQYYVQHSGWTWSVPEYALFKYTRRGSPKNS